MFEWERPEDLVTTFGHRCDAIDKRIHLRLVADTAVHERKIEIGSLHVTFKKIKRTNNQHRIQEDFVARIIPSGGVADAGGSGAMVDSPLRRQFVGHPARAR